MTRTVLVGALAWALTAPAVLEREPVTECSEADYARDADDMDAVCFIPRTCAECRTDAECDALCQVKACEKAGEAGCWMPDDQNARKP